MAGEGIDPVMKNGGQGLAWQCGHNAQLQQSQIHMKDCGFGSLVNLNMLVNMCL